MSRVLVTGGTGILGTALRPRLNMAGHTVRIMSRRTPKPGEDQGVEWAQADLSTGDGLAAAVEGAEVIIHAASAGFGDSHQTDVEGTRRLLEAAGRAGVQHLVYISIAGIEHVDYEYYRHKLEAERLIEQSGVAYSILRAVQFHALIDGILKRLVRFPIAVVDTRLTLQPVDEGEVADRLVELVASGPSGRVPDFGGPEIRRMGELARMWLAARDMRALIVGLPFPGGLWAGWRKGLTTVPEHRQGKVTFEEWAARRYGPAVREAPAH